MPTYLMLTTLTEKGVQTLKSNPSRLREVNRDVEELGARVLHQWASLGEYDFVNIVEAPDDLTIARVSVALDPGWSERTAGKQETSKTRRPLHGLTCSTRRPVLSETPRSTVVAFPATAKVTLVQRFGASTMVTGVPAVTVEPVTVKGRRSTRVVNEA